MTKKIRVVIVDDSALSRAILRELLEAEGDLEVVGEAENGYMGVGVIDALKPDVVTMDIDMPGPSGLETISWVMEKTPVPILVVTGERLGEGSSLGFHAIERGAIDFTAKPSIVDGAAVARLCSLVRTLAGMPVFRVANQPSKEATPTRAKELEAPWSTSPGIEIVGFAAGVGGHRSLLRILKRIPPDFPAAIAVTQHMAPRFALAFARYLETITPVAVRVANAAARRVVPGELYICDGGSHLVVPRRGEVATSEAAPVRGYRPSASVFFESLAEVYGKKAIGVILSGSGDDGAAGLKRLRDSGALTVGENADSAMPPDMPCAAASAGAVERSLPAELVADFLVGSITGRSLRTTAPPPDAFPE